MAIILVAVFALGGYFIQSNIYSKYCYEKLSVKLEFKDTGIFEKESTVLIETVENRKWLFIWWLIIRFKISKNILFEKDQEGDVGEADYNYRRDLFSLSAYQKATRKFNITALGRGYYEVKTLSLSSGDLFLRYKMLKDADASASLYVYPSPVNTGELAVPFERIMGEILARRKLLEDNFQIRGIRDYTQFDNMKNINWSATAKSGELKVNEYDFTASQEIELLLNVDRFNEWEGDGALEESIRIASSIAAECIDMGIQVGLETNSCSLITNERVYLEGSVSPGYKTVFYQSFAGIDTKKSYEPFAETLKTAVLKKGKNPFYVVISQYYDSDLIEQIQKFSEEGYNFYWILPKYRDEVLKLEYTDNMFIWEVLDR